MINLAFSDVKKNLDAIGGMDKQLRPPPVFFYPYLKRVLEEDIERNNPEGPVDIKVAPENKYLLKGEFEPKQIIHLDGPVRMDDGTPMWFNSSAGECYLRFGYENLDARKISSLKLDMEYIHGFLGGSSGHGKSVTLNAMMGALCYEYAPWELELHLSDAKIIEFKKYGVNHRIPHIASIAATEDPDFVISVLDRAYREMNERAKIFGNIGASNLKNFRKKTGLAMPRVLVVMDEVESTFKMAGKQATKIANYIDGFARLGRAAGYHLFLATQNMSSDIPSSAVGQIRIRCCLGANEKTSQSVLGNSGATENFGRIGRLITNCEVLNGGDTSPYNIKFQTPFIDDNEFEQEMEFLERKGKEVGYQRVMSFYDENDMKTVEQFDTLVDKAINRMKVAGEVTSSQTPICLGFPAFVTEDEDEMLKIRLDQKDVENILISSASAERVAAHLHNITKSLADCGHVIQLFTTELDQAKWVYKPAVTLEARNAEQSPLATIGSLVRKRLFMLQVDNLAGNATYNREAVEETFAKDGIPKDAWGNERVCQRAVVFSQLLKAKEWEDVRYLFPSYKEVFNEFEKYHCRVKQLEPSDFPKAVFVVGDLSKIVGWGRDNKSKLVTNLKKALQDANRAGVLYVLFTRSMEGLTDLVSGLRYTIFDAPDSKDWGRLRTEEPASLNSKLALIYDNLDNDTPQKKFKRTLLREEF